MPAAAGLAVPHGVPGVPAGPGRQRGAAAPRRRVTDLLLPAANRRRGRARRDFIHSFIKQRRSAAGKRALPGPRPAVRGTDTHGNPPRRCYPSSRRPRRISRWRGCTAHSGTGTGSPRTP